MALDPQTRDQLLDAVRRFVSERLRPLEAEVSETDAIPDAVVAEMRDLGLFGLSIPEAYGGLELSMEDECRVAIELGRTSPAFRSVVGANIGIGSQGLVIYGTPEQKARWLPVIAAGEVVTSFALTEAEAGSDSASVRTRATREGARLRDAGANTTLEAASAKLIASEMVGRVADRAVQVFGGAGYVSDYGIERLYRDVRLFRIYEGASEIQKLVIARETLKRGG